jgi:hypothetical protein
MLCGWPTSPLSLSSQGARPCGICQGVAEGVPIGGRALRDDRAEPVAEHPAQQLPLIERLETVEIRGVEIGTGLQAGAQQLPPTRQARRDAHARTEEQGQLTAASAVGQRCRRLQQHGVQRPAPLPAAQVLHRPVHRRIRCHESDVDRVIPHDVVRDVEEAADHRAPVVAESARADSQHRQHDQGQHTPRIARHHRGDLFQDLADAVQQPRQAGPGRPFDVEEPDRVRAATVPDAGSGPTRTRSPAVVPAEQGPPGPRRLKIRAGRHHDRVVPQQLDPAVNCEDVPPFPAATPTRTSTVRHPADSFPSEPGRSSTGGPPQP